MHFSLLTSSAVVLATTAAAAAAATSAGTNPVTSCPGNTKLCFSVSVPSSSASSGNGDIFFQIQAPATYSWASLGQGLEMAGSNIFVIYTNAAQNNVTLSSRLGTGEIEPLADTTAQVELLAGSGVANGLMTANVRCANCKSWPGGSMSLTDAESSWIWAYKAGSGLASDSASTNIAIHDNMGTMVFDLTKAVGGSDSVNPFVSNNGAIPLNLTTTTSGVSTSSSSTSGANVDTATTAHGVLMGIAFLVLFPCGALLRSVIPRTSIWIHAGVQSVALLAIVVAAGLGIFVALASQEINTTHAVLGLLVTVMMALQPLWGLLQHRHFRRFQNRGAWGWVHRVVGGVAIVLGMVNGGLGLQLADTLGEQGANAYVLVAAVLGSIYCTTFAAMALSKRSAAKRAAEKRVGWSKMHDGGARPRGRRGRSQY